MQLGRNLLFTSGQLMRTSLGERDQIWTRCEGAFDFVGRSQQDNAVRRISAPGLSDQRQPMRFGKFERFPDGIDSECERQIVPMRETRCLALIVH